LDWSFLVFLFFASLTCGFALAALLAQNVVRMAFFLILSLGASSGLFFLAGAEFVGAMQLMIYVGGTLVLLIFGVMLTASDAAITMRSSVSDWFFACIPSGAIFILLASSALAVPRWNERQPEPSPEFVAAANDQTARLGLAFLGLRLEPGEEGAAAGARAGYLFPFEMVSVHLLVALVGAAHLARAKRRAITPLPESIAAQPSMPGWYRLAFDILLALAALKTTLYLFAPQALFDLTVAYGAPPPIANELTELNRALEHWRLPSAAAIAVVGLGFALLRFRKVSGLFVETLGFVIAIAQFWYWGATTTAQIAAVSWLLLTMLLAFAYFAVADRRDQATGVAL
jgi:NADH:ubiquinone oxidoreductase subunit 6 (subunit J)